MYILKKRSVHGLFGSLFVCLLVCCLAYVLLGLHLGLISASTFQFIGKSLAENPPIHPPSTYQRLLSPRYANTIHYMKHIIRLSTLTKNISLLQTNKKENESSSAATKVQSLHSALFPSLDPKNLHTNKSKHIKGSALKNPSIEKLFHIPEVPLKSLYDRVAYIPRPVINYFLTLPQREYHEEVLILTPIHNVADHLNHYSRMLQNLTYPRHLISVALGEDCSTDETLIVAKGIVEELSTIFKSVKLFHFNLTGQITGRWTVVHDHAMQLTRRSHLAKSRNLLLKNSLGNQTWVLWIDSDVSHLPADLVQQLIFADKDVVVPSCLFNDGINLRVYDKNTWRETKISLQKQQQLQPNQLVLEGYGPSDRLYLPDLRAEGRLVPIDGVGGCSLLIRAECHRKGLKFPEHIYQNHIETEGLAKMAKTMRFSVYGMPFVEVYH
ncbi:mannan polymerase complex subunit mnn9-like [Argonauta hians]